MLYKAHPERKEDLSSDASSRDNKQGSSCTTGCNKGAPVVTHTHIHAHGDYHKHKETQHTVTHISVCTYMLLGLSTVWSTNRTQLK